MSPIHRFLCICFCLWNFYTNTHIFSLAPSLSLSLTHLFNDSNLFSFIGVYIQRKFGAANFRNCNGEMALKPKLNETNRIETKPNETKLSINNTNNGFLRCRIVAMFDDVNANVESEYTNVRMLSLSSLRLLVYFEHSLSKWAKTV